MKPDLHAALRATRLFSNLDERALGVLAEFSSVQRLARGDVVVRAGERAAGVYGVLKGQLRVYSLAPSGKERVLHLAGPGQTVLEVAVLGRFAAPAFCEASEDTLALVLAAEPFCAALEADHGLCLALLSSMAMRVRNLVDLLEDIAMRDAAGRVARYLVQVSDPSDGSIMLPGLKKHLASYLNLTSETLSRTLRRLVEAGLIGTQGERSTALCILDRAGLDAVAQGAYPRV